MLSKFYFFVCLVAMFTSFVAAFPVAPSIAIPSTFTDTSSSPETIYVLDRSRTLVSRQEGNPQRILFCDKNPIGCRNKFPEYCTDMTKPAPAWCNWSQPSSLDRRTAGDMETLTATRTTYEPPTLVARQEHNPQRSSFCRFNPLKCQAKLPQYCTDMEHPSAELCTWSSYPPDPPDSSKRVAEARGTVERNPQDRPQKQNPGNEDPAHPSGRSWCTNHPNHPYCNSQSCRDYSGFCKGDLAFTERQDYCTHEYEQPRLLVSISHQHRVHQLCSPPCFHHPEDTSCAFGEHNNAPPHKNIKRGDPEDPNPWRDYPLRLARDWIQNATAEERTAACQIQAWPTYVKTKPFYCTTNCYNHPGDPTCAVRRPKNPLPSPSSPSSPPYPPVFPSSSSAPSSCSSPFHSKPPRRNPPSSQYLGSIAEMEKRGDFSTTTCDSNGDKFWCSEFCRSHQMEDYCRPEFCDSHPDHWTCRPKYPVKHDEGEIAGEKME